jgi:nucleoside-diphosphate-sugar epimerase
LAVLITGGSGLVGSHIIMELLEEKKAEKVIIYDVATPRNSFVIKHLGKEVIYVDGNVLDPGRLFETVKKYNVDGIIHTTAFINYKYIVSNPMISIQTNVTGTLNVLELARINDLKIVFTSSGAVYGKVKNYATEKMPVKPTDIYGVTKSAGEMLGEQYSRTYGIDFITVRLYFIYGYGQSLNVESLEQALSPPVHPLNILYLFMLKSVKEESLRIENGGDSKLDLTYVKDAAHGVLLAYYAKKPRHKIYNISSGQSHSLKEIAEIINQHTGRKFIQIGSGMIEGWPQRAQYLDNTLAKRELGYSPRYGVKGGLTEFYDLIKKDRM